MGGFMWIHYSQIIDCPGRFMLGRCSLLTRKKNYPKGHPQVARWLCSRQKASPTIWIDAQKGKTFESISIIRTWDHATLAKKRAVVENSSVIQISRSICLAHLVIVPLDGYYSGCKKSDSCIF